MSFYQDLISRILKRQKRADIDPRHIEAYMRLRVSTLDNLDARDFSRMVKWATGCVDGDGKKLAEELAMSYGLWPEKCPWCGCEVRLQPGKWDGHKRRCPLRPASESAS